MTALAKTLHADVVPLDERSARQASSEIEGHIGDSANRMVMRSTAHWAAKIAGAHGAGQSAGRELRAGITSASTTRCVSTPARSA